jgi:hypothetical protein
MGDVNITISLTLLVESTCGVLIGTRPRASNSRKIRPAGSQRGYGVGWEPFDMS